MQEDSRQVICRFLGQDRKRRSETKCYGTPTVAEIMMINFCESGHPVFRGSSALERGDLKSHGKGTSPIHFNGSDETVKVVLRTIFPSISPVSTEQ